MQSILPGEEDTSPSACTQLSIQNKSWDSTEINGTPSSLWKDTGTSVGASIFHPEQYLHVESQMIFPFELAYRGWKGKAVLLVHQRSSMPLLLGNELAHQRSADKSILKAALEETAEERNALKPASEDKWQCAVLSRNAVTAEADTLQHETEKYTLEQ